MKLDKIIEYSIIPTSIGACWIAYQIYKTAKPKYELDHVFNQYMKEQYENVKNQED